MAKDIKLYSYMKVWKVEKKIYRFENIKLNVPLVPRKALYFVIGLIVIWVLGIIIPPIKSLPIVIRLAAAPYGIMYFLTKKKLDGKNPIKYALDGMQYLLTVRGMRYDGFRREFSTKDEKIRLDWNTSKGTFR